MHPNVTNSSIFQGGPNVFIAISEHLMNFEIIFTWLVVCHLEVPVLRILFVYSLANKEFAPDIYRVFPK